MLDECTKRLVERYVKILKINITNDTYTIIKHDFEQEDDYCTKTDKISEWFSLFAKNGNIYLEDIPVFKQYTSLVYLRQFFKKNDDHWIQYRRLSNNKYGWYEMEMISAEDYSDNNQQLYLFVKKMNEVSKAEIKQNISKVNKKVLLVEKNVSERNSLAAILEDSYEVLQSENSSDAYEVLKEYSGDIAAIFIDVDMTDEKERDFYKKVKRVSQYDNIPIIIATDGSSPEYELECLENGVAELVIKPCNVEIIKNRINKSANLTYLTSLLNTLKRDTLTGLYTKPFFFKKVEETLKSNPEKKYRMVCTDIESFRLINENYGEDVGDAVLSYIAEKVTEILPNVLFGGRISSDIFAFLREDIPFEYDKEAWRGLRENAPVANLVVKYGLSDVDRKITVQKMCDHAHMAVQSIKKKYDVPYAEYTDEMQKKIVRQQQIVDNMENALKEHQFKVYYQPKYCFSEKRICGAEALVRWIHPTIGFLSPAEFIPIFESNGFIVKLDEYVRQQVCQDMARWSDMGLPSIPVSVNISRRDFEEDGLAESIIRLVKEYNINPKLLHIEVTESAFSDKIDVISRVIKQLRKEGFIIELDDFGSGYSALTTLNNIEFDVMKIDRSILYQDADNDNNKVLEFCMELAKIMDLKTVMEGVETKEQLDVLSLLGCDSIQGYYYSKPLPVEEFEVFVKQHY